MKPWLEAIRLTKPLRDARLWAGVKVPAPGEASEAQLRASYERGRADAEKALSAQLVQQRMDVQELCNGAMKSLKDAVPQVIRDSEQTMITLALEIAQKLVAEMPISAEMIEAAVRESLAQVENSAEYDVRLNPADLDLLKKMGSILLRPDDDGKVRIHSSPEISRGGCLVQTRFGVIDGRRETKLDALKKSLLS